MTPEKQDKTLELSKHWSPEDNENNVSSKSVKCDEICSNY